ncbi:Protein of unknown function [Gryllus bimaculatus]|nr:Protein of unknown function [Gryllus bimaculatus]
MAHISKMLLFKAQYQQSLALVRERLEHIRRGLAQLDATTQRFLKLLKQMREEEERQIIEQLFAHFQDGE